MDIGMAEVGSANSRRLKSILTMMKKIYGQQEKHLFLKIGSNFLLEEVPMAEIGTYFQPAKKHKFPGLVNVSRSFKICLQPFWKFSCLIVAYFDVRKNFIGTAESSSNSI